MVHTGGHVHAECRGPRQFLLALILLKWPWSVLSGWGSCPNSESSLVLLCSADRLPHSLRQHQHHVWNKAVQWGKSREGLVRWLSRYVCVYCVLVSPPLTKGFALSFIEQPRKRHLGGEMKDLLQTPLTEFLQDIKSLTPDDPNWPHKKHRYLSTDIHERCVYGG